MTPIPKKIRKEIDQDPRYSFCALAGVTGHVCGGRITMEHAFIYAGKQIQNKWSIVPLCAAGQEVDQYQDAHTMNKEMNQWVALNQATDEELGEFVRVDFHGLRERLNRKFGKYIFRKLPNEDTGIRYDLLTNKNSFEHAYW